MIKELIKIANTLDARGLVLEAGSLDRVIRLASGSQELVFSEGDAKVYYDSEWDEYRVVPPASIGADDHYHTDDKDDAIATARSMAGLREEGDEDDEPQPLEDVRREQVIALGAGEHTADLIESLYWHSRTETPWRLTDRIEEVIHLNEDGRLDLVFNNGADDPQQFKEHDETEHFYDLVRHALRDDSSESLLEPEEIDSLAEKIMNEVV
jgi:hypothetical protein